MISPCPFGPWVHEMNPQGFDCVFARLRGSVTISTTAKSLQDHPRIDSVPDSYLACITKYTTSQVHHGERRNRVSHRRGGHQGYLFTRRTGRGRVSKRSPRIHEDVIFQCVVGKYASHPVHFRRDALDYIRCQMSFLCITNPNTGRGCAVVAGSSLVERVHRQTYV